MPTRRPEIEAARPRLRAGDQHNNLSGRKDPNAHPQYYLKGVPFTTTVGPTTLACPVTITQVTSACNPIFQLKRGASEIYGIYFDGPVFAGATDYISQNMTILPSMVPPAGTLPLHYCGYEENYWKGVYAAKFSGQRLEMASSTKTLSSATYNPLTDITSYMIYRLNPTVDPVEIQTIDKPVIGAFSATPLVDLINVSTANVVQFRDQIDLLGNADERIITGTNGTWDLGPNEVTRAWYDGSTQRWRLLK